MSTLNVSTIIPDAGTNTDLSLDGKNSGKVKVEDALGVEGHAAVGNSGTVDATRALTVVGASDGTGSNILVGYNSSLAAKFSIRDDGLANFSGNTAIGATFGASFPLDLRGAGATAAQAMRVADASPTEYFGIFNCNSGADAPNAANACVKIRGMATTTRSINAGGTVNASGADYAEYMTKADGCGTIEKGSVCGVNADGKLTDVFANAHSFVVKSTNPSYVGGDTWGVEFEGDKYELDDAGNETFLQDAELEAARQKVDRIAFSGQVPCTITGDAEVGDYVIPQAKDDGIEAIAVSSPTFEQYKMAVGKVWKLGEIKHIVAVKIG